MAFYLSSLKTRGLADIKGSEFDLDCELNVLSVLEEDDEISFNCFFNSLMKFWLYNIEADRSLRKLPLRPLLFLSENFSPSTVCCVGLKFNLFGSSTFLNPKLIIREADLVRGA